MIAIWFASVYRQRDQGRFEAINGTGHAPLGLPSVLSRRINNKLDGRQQACLRHCAPDAV
ncbi:hypothetical protein [Advenella sp. FME57]|uniref:Uncharacterized protein n=1 Tax=Advenella kashmirensis TaxID=310575 RepID=A0A356LD48_9BURK|nr:hypothetical protein [Advenella sp. FME57]HBP28698.1 hypothetical protein [Advenella kashmirensis]